MIDEEAIRARYAAVKDHLDERGRRVFVAAGYGGTAAVRRATGVARSTIVRGSKDLLAAAHGVRPLSRALGDAYEKAILTAAPKASEAVAFLAAGHR